MSKVNDLIQKLCPNGVKFDKLENITLLQAGDRITTAMMSDDYDFDVIGGGTLPTGKYNNYNREHCVTISRAGSAGFVNWKENKFWATDVCFTASKNNDYMDIKFVYYYLKNAQKDLQQHLYGGSMPKLEKNYLWKYPIPIPPLEVQNEIVRILDKFGELEAELYEFWRGNVFSSNDNLVKLDDICKITAGGTPSKTHSEYWEDGTIKWLGSTVCENKKGISEVTNYITELGLSKSSAKLLKPGTTLIAMVGATIGKVAYLDYEACTNQNVAGLYPKNINELDTSYLYHACRNLYSTFLDYANGKFSMASLGYIKNLEISLPDINEQRRIAKLLDKFDTLINDISDGLPAEIELRREQYEYYRNKLLSFEELSVSE